MSHKYVYLFSEGNASMRELLGGKGANLAEMTNLGLPVPQGFTISTEAAAANACGAEWADKLAAQYATRDPLTLCDELGLKLKTPATPAGGGQVLFAQFVQPDEITIFTDCLDKAETLGGLIPARAKLQSIILAHELFHAVEEANPDIYTRTEKIELWRKPFSNKSCIVCLSEIAAMAFAKQLLGLDFNPYALDVLLVYPYDAQAACGLYAEICDLMKEE